MKLISKGRQREGRGERRRQQQQRRRQQGEGGEKGVSRGKVRWVGEWGKMMHNGDENGKTVKRMGTDTLAQEHRRYGVMWRISASRDFTEHVISFSSG